MNPDGFEFEYKASPHLLGAGRLNANQIDLNRNFPSVELEHGPNNDMNLIKQQVDNGTHRLDKLVNDQQPLEPEVRAAMHWSLIYPFVLSGSLHGGALVANYPFDNRVTDSKTLESKSPDDKTFQMLAKSYSYVSRVRIEIRPSPLSLIGSSKDAQGQCVRQVQRRHHERSGLVRHRWWHARLVVRVHVGHGGDHRVGLRQIS